MVALYLTIWLVWRAFLWTLRSEVIQALWYFGFLFVYNVVVAKRVGRSSTKKLSCMTMSFFNFTLILRCLSFKMVIVGLQKKRLQCVNVFDHTSKTVDPTNSLPIKKKECKFFKVFEWKMFYRGYKVWPINWHENPSNRLIQHCQ